MTTLFLTRHGETVWNAERRLQGWQDSPLSEKGVRQAEALAERLTGIDFEAIYTSPTGRAHRTAEIVRGERPLTIIPCDDLREINLGTWEGRKWDVVMEEEPERLLTFWKKPHLYEPDGGESFVEVRDRVLPTLRDIVDAHQGNVLVVTHAVVLKLVLAEYEGRPLADIWEEPRIEPTSLSVVNLENGEATLER
ncbi:MAG: histidine phosphatase family protein, partial [Anaerolineae bacterium]